MAMFPLFVLQLFAGPIMESVGVESSIAADVGKYCTLLNVSSALLIIEIHFYIVFVNLGHCHCATINSLLSGVGVDVICAYYFIYKWDWGVEGAAWVQITVKSTRVLVWLVLMLYYKLFDTFFVSSTKEALLTRKEFNIFFKLAAPTIVLYFSGWLIFELQIVAIGKISSISAAGIAAGAIWVQLESTLASVQSGWISATSMRTLSLMGKEDPGAAKSFALMCFLSFFLVGLSNIPFVLYSGDLAAIVSADPQVQHWFSQICWVLAIHTQTRICSINATCLLVPFGFPTTGVTSTFIAFYLFAAPISGTIALSNLVTTDVTTKMLACVSATAIAQVPLAVFGFIYMYRLDWNDVAKTIASRANSDKTPVLEGLTGPLLTTPPASPKLRSV